MTNGRSIATLAAALAALALAGGALADAAPSSMARHQQFMRAGVPQPYGGQKSPLERTAATIERGRALYDENCAVCHGPAGQGDGPGAKDLEAPPANLGHILAMPPMGDDYLLWAIAEGGAPWGTPMPAFEGTLPRDDIWRLIHFMRAGFPR